MRCVLPCITLVGIVTFIAEKIPMFNNIFEMLVTIPIAIIILAIQPYVCFAAIAMSSVSGLYIKLQFHY